MRSAELTCPLYAATLSGPREGATAQGHGGLLPAATLLPYPRPNGSEGNGIGNARGIPPRGVRRRHLFGCEGVGTSFRGRTARGSVTISATSLARVQRGGVNPGPCARGFGAPCPIPTEPDGLERIGRTVYRDSAEARAPWSEYSTDVLGCVKDGPRRARRGNCQNQDSQDFGIFRIGLWSTRCKSSAPQL